MSSSFARSVERLRAGEPLGVLVEELLAELTPAEKGYLHCGGPGAGHFVPREAPGTVADLILDELRVG